MRDFLVFVLKVVSYAVHTKEILLHEMQTTRDYNEASADIFPGLAIYFGVFPWGTLVILT